MRAPGLPARVSERAGQLREKGLGGLSVGALLGDLCAAVAAHKKRSLQSLGFGLRKAKYLLPRYAANTAKIANSAWMT